LETRQYWQYSIQILPFWQYSAVFGSISYKLAVFGSISYKLAVFGSIRQYLYENWQYLAVFVWKIYLKNF
jgi:hypothetical protein